MEAKVFIVCGKICAGKSTYTKKLIKEKKELLENEFKSDYRLNMPKLP